MDVSDTIIGNLRMFITDDILRDYDKIHIVSHAVPAYVDEAISGKADLSAIPSNTSQLSNDSGFITSADISSKADISSVPSFSIDGQVGDLEIQHVSMQEYEQILEDGPLSNVLYIVSGEYESAFGKQIKNLSAGTDLSDAVNLEQMQSAISSSELEISGNLQYFYRKTETSSS